MNIREEIKRKIPKCMIMDRYRISGALKKAKDKKPAEQQTYLDDLKKKVEQSVEKAENRKRCIPTILFNDELPVTQKKDDVAKLISENQVIVLCGETGSGKTTQLPKICLELGRGVFGYIGHTQPRRLAARTVANRIAEELGQGLGKSVGYKVRFNEKISHESHIKLMTDGILLAETQNDKFLNQYDTLIIDEAHERSLNIDFLLGYIKRILPKRPDLKVIITSATIDPERISKHFNDAPIIEISGRTYPVEVRYRPPYYDDEGYQDKNQFQLILEAIEEINRKDRGDILIFLPGERDIKETKEFLSKANLQNTVIYPLYSRLSHAEQIKIFQKIGQRKIVLSTNVAETSLTVPGIKYVIDPGTARISRYSHRTKVQRLPIEAISQASANQRKGRCGRVSSGVCYRLYSEDDFESREEFTQPEILRTNLASVILQMESMHLGKVDDFPFIEKPDSRLINDGYKLLLEIGAINDNRKLTKTGRTLAKIPIDPRISKMLLSADIQGVLSEVLIIGSVLEVQDPRLRPLEAATKADEAHQQFTDERSDFLSYLKLWQILEDNKTSLSNNKFRKWCADNFISYIRVREWWDIHHQLERLLKENGFKVGKKIEYPSIFEDRNQVRYESIHKAILSGYISNIAHISDRNEYSAARNIKLKIFPGSGLSKKQPKWIMASEFIETSALFASTVARIDPVWLETTASHLISHHYFDPHWSKKSGIVIGFDKITLYGLTINPKKRVDWVKINATEAREVMIRSALVEQLMDSKVEFYLNNNKLIANVQNLESKSRRRDILIDDDLLFDFYDVRIPLEVTSQKALEKWYKTLSRKEQEKLHLSEELLMKHSAESVTEEQFPSSIHFGDTSLSLKYVFEPGSANDGVNLTVPLALLNHICDKRLDWLVPGLLLDKITDLIKSLPKSYRRNFVPAPDFANACLNVIKEKYENIYDESIYELLSLELKRMTGIEVPVRQWGECDISDFLRINIHVINDENEVIGVSRSLEELKERFKNQIKNLLVDNKSTLEKQNITSWDIDELPESVEVSRKGVTFKAFPAFYIEDNGTISIKLFHNIREAQQNGLAGINKLTQIILKDQVKYLSRNISNLDKIALTFAPIGSKDDLVKDIIDSVFHRTFFASNDYPKNKDDYHKLLNDKRSNLVTVCNEIARELLVVMAKYHDLTKQLKSNASLAILKTYKEISEEVSLLIYPGFISNTPPEWFRRIKHYLNAMEIRIQKLEFDPKRDSIWASQVKKYTDTYRQILEKNDSEYSQQEIIKFKWMIEEFKISIYAQEIKTAIPISEKRLDKQINIIMNGK